MAGGMELHSKGRTKHDPGRSARITGFFLIALFLPLEAETLEVAVVASVHQALPQTTQRIIRALDNSGVQFNLTVLPNKRSFEMLRRGNIGLEFFRTTVVTDEVEELVKLEPRLALINFNMVTSIETPGHCRAGEDEYRKMTVAGVLGIGLHQLVFFPKFRDATAVNDIATALKFVALQRADVTFMPNEIMGLFPAETLRNLIVCPGNYTAFPFFAHLHEDYLWARDKIEKALQAEFVTKNEASRFD